MSLCEQYSAGAILLFPTRRFCEELVRNRQAPNWEQHAATGAGTLRLASVYWDLKYVQDAYKPLEELPPPFQALVARYHHTVSRNVEDTGWDYELWNPERQIPPALQIIQGLLCFVTQRLKMM